VDRAVYFYSGRYMTHKKDEVRIGPLATELGVTQKTIYNWINDGRLEIKKPGIVSRSEAWEVFDHMKEKRVEISYFLSSYGIKRDANGRFTSELEQ
jgi:predicted DNA-binding transcriptional regulator AlpA